MISTIASLAVSMRALHHLQPANSLTPRGKMWGNLRVWANPNEVSQALVKAGVLSDSVYKVIHDPTMTLYSYHLLATGKPYFDAKADCFAFERRVIAVTNYYKWRRPGAYIVEFTYDFTHVPDWAYSKPILDFVGSIPQGDESGWRRDAER